jgi:dTMP kinase
MKTFLEGSMKGRFIVLEGTDGAGKGTQFLLLQKRLQDEGYEVEPFDFPQYGQPSAYFVEQYLNGRYGGLEAIGPEKGSLFYAMDRFEASLRMREAMSRGRMVISNRYVGSNMGHQGAKFSSDAKRQKYFRWVENLEFNILGIPKPDLNIVLHLPADMAQLNVDKKQQRLYLGDQKRDIHEADLNHLQMAERAYLQMCDLFADRFTKISCMGGKSMLSREDIAQKVWVEVSKLLSIKTKTAGVRI